MTRAADGAGKIIIGVDFGNTTTKLTISTGHGCLEPVPVVIPGISRSIAQGGDRFASVIPSVIHYANDGTVLAGMQVADKGVLSASGTVRWMAHYTSIGSPVRFRINGEFLSYQQAASDFLCSIIKRTGDLYQIYGAELVVAVPDGTRDHYTPWLAGLNAGRVISRVRIIEQPTAVASACLADFKGRITFMIIDFGGSKVDISIVIRFFEHGESRYRIVGRASGNFGGRTLDRLLLRFATSSAGLQDPDQEQTEILLPECEKAKENLTAEHAAEINWNGKKTKRVTRQDFEDLLKGERIYTMFSSVLQQSMDSAASRGYDDDSISAVILIGGTGAIPSFRKLVEDRFGSAKLLSDRPLDAISRGAALWYSRSSPEDQILHDYAIRIWNTENGVFELRTIIKRGCPVPSNGPVARFRIQATYDGQTRLGVPLYQLASPGPDSRDVQYRELRFGPAGTTLVGGEHSSSGQPRYTWINERKLPLIPADPPAMRGEPRFELSFSIDSSHELLISARDLRTGRQVFENVRAGMIR
jgi:molecular chaperone DnaK